MAAHIDSVKGSSIPKVDKAVFYSTLRQGDYVFCSGLEKISVAIEEQEAKGGSPFSHILMAWLPGPWAKQWNTLESTSDKGVHVGLLSDYVDYYDGDLVIARRPILVDKDIDDELNAGLALLDDKYNWQSEVTYALHNQKLLRFFPVVTPDKTEYCSGLQQVMTYATPHAVKTTGLIPATPEEMWLEPSVSPVCALLKT